MAKIEQLLQDIQDAPDGPHIAAIVDFDGRIVAGYSPTAVIREHILCTELEVVGGKFTGSVIAPLCFGPGKIRVGRAT